jgi:hypothetical protein
MVPDPDGSYIDLRARARQQVDDGLLPDRVVDTLHAGYGSSLKTCCLCGQIITPEQVEYELSGSGIQSISFHIGCYTAWRDECLQRTASPEAPQASRAADARERP